MLCTHCGEDLGLPQSSLARLDADEPRLCDLCQEKRPAFAKAIAYGRYENELRGLIHLMKYDGMTPIAKRLGERLAAPVAALPIEPGTDVLVVPVPLYRTKRRRRGFNHAERIATALAGELRRSEKSHRWTMARGVLRRQRPTESQSRLSPQGRRRNLRGAFIAPDTSRIRDRVVLLVDDIYTTGATAAACSQVLLRAGAKAVWVATVARTQREGVALVGHGERDGGESSRKAGMSPVKATAHIRKMKLTHTPPVEVRVAQPITMQRPVLVLNASYEPINICGARRALVLVLKGVARTEEEQGAILHAARMRVPMPS